SYENSLKYYWDLNNSLDTAREEGHEAGLEAGREEGRKKQLEIAKNLKQTGLASEAIAQATGLSVAIIETL
ncbi:MAG: Rpn family recombination-promoting nuclease/putative transposase, partial [Ostreibacterium sp.]